LNIAKLQHDTLKPRLGTYIVSIEPIPEQEPANQGSEIFLLTVGFEQPEMNPIISVLAKDAVKSNDHLANNLLPLFYNLIYTLLA